MPIRICILLTTVGLLAACTNTPALQARSSLQQQVMDTERAFAKTMADRDYASFEKFLSPEAIFFSDGGVLRGRQSVSSAWKAYFGPVDAPFSWKPDKVEVLESGSLALSTGPVYDARGKQIATFNSIWRQESPGVWRIVFDKGSEVCT
jgi:ketosteroid isomerase-like protein